MKNPFRGLRFSLLDFHSAHATTGTKIAMLGIALVPLIYGALYLMAFYDPYGNLDTMPVAVVNEDVPAYTAAGQKVNAGADLVDELKESKSLDYHFVDNDEAQEGLEAGTYYNKIVIPEDFSQKIASADSDDPQQARLILVTNDANNYLSSILGASVMRVVTSKTNYSVGQNYYVEIFDSIEESGDSIKVAADGATELSDGLVDAHDGSKTITENLKTAEDGSKELGDGLKTAYDGSATITSKLGDATDGAKQLADGTVSAADGSATITSNLKSAADGAAALDAGLKKLTDGLASGQTGSAELAAGLHQLQGEGSAQLAAGANGLYTQLQAQQDNFKALKSGSYEIENMVGTLTSVGGQVQQLASATNGLKTKLGTIQKQAAGLPTLADGIQAQGAKVGQDLEAIKSQLTEPLTTIGGAAQTIKGSLTNIQTAGGDIKTVSDALTNANKDVNEDGTITLTLSAADMQAISAALADAGTQLNTGGTSIGTGLTTISDTLTAASGMDTSQVTTDAETLANMLKDQLVPAASDLMNKSNDLLNESSTTINSAVDLTNQLSGYMTQSNIQRVYDFTKGVRSVMYSLTNDGDATILGAAAQLSAGAKTVNSKMEAAAAGADKLAAGTKQLSDGAVTAESGAASLTSGLNQLQAGSATLTQGLTTAKTGSASLFQGLGQLQAGSATLTKGLSTAKDGSASLTSGLDQLHEGSQTLTDGLATAKDGSQELADGLSDGVTTIEDKTKGADAKAAMMSEPVELEQEAYTEVDNYGTGFAPYFIALGLWVGALVMTFLFKPLNNRLIASGASPAVSAFAGLAPWLILGAIQAVLLGATIQFPCGIGVLHPAAYYGLCILAAAVFCSLVQAISAVFGFPGKFVAVVLLMLQLTTAAGTFPIQTEFQIFQTLSPYLPMTYVVHSLRMAMRGIDLSLVGHDVAMLLAFGGASFMVTCLAARRKRLITMSDLHPLVDL